MSLEVLDGPAKGKYYTIRRAPIYLRMVVDRKTGAKDALDQLDDEPTPDELVSVYVQQSFAGYTHIDLNIEKGDFRNYVNAVYQRVSKVDGESLRQTDAWRAWVDQRVAADARRTRGQASRYGTGYQSHGIQLDRGERPRGPAY